MKEIYNLKSEVDKLKDASGGIVNKRKKFENSADEYFISDVTEDMLIELGYKFGGYTTYNTSPYYEKGNILAYFDDVVLHVMEQTYNVVE